MKKIKVLIPDGESNFATRVAQALSNYNNIELYIICRYNNRKLFYCSNVKGFIINDLAFDTKDKIQIINTYIAEKSIELLLPVSVIGIRFISENKENINSHCKLTPVANVDIFDTVNNKATLAKLFRGSNVPHPKTWLFEELSELSDTNTFKRVLAKPSGGSGGLNIKIINSLQELTIFCTENKSDLSNYIFQEYRNGYDIDISLFASDGKIISYTIQKPYKYDKTNFTPSTALEFLHDDRVYETAIEFVKLTKWNGIGHIDMRIDTDTNELFFIEINPRFWASLLGSVSVGVNFPYHVICHSLNLPLVENKKIPSYYFVMKDYKKFLLLIWYKFIGKEKHFIFFNLPYLLKNIRSFYYERTDKHIDYDY